MKQLSMALILFAAGAGAAEHDHAAMGKAAAREKMWQASLARAPMAVTAALDARGRLWVARVVEGRLQLSRADGLHAAFGAPVTVNATPERIAADGENRPKIAFGPGSEIYVSWTQSLETPFSGHVRFARSLDDGRTFGAPLTVNDNRDAISHRFDALAVTPDGHVHLLWLDKRDSAQAQSRGEPFAGISLYHAVSTDRGATFSANRRLAAHTCECCRIALALDRDGGLVALWRHVFDKNIRDHALMRVNVDTAPRRVTFEGWAIDACPHHGPALAVSASGAWHLAWFSGAPGKTGLHYARTTDRGATAGAPRAIGNPAAQPGRAALAAQGMRIVLAWKEFDGTASVVRMQQSFDDGAHWSAPVSLARSEGASDHPQLLAHNGHFLLVWHTQRDGLLRVGVGE